MRITKKLINDLYIDKKVSIKEISKIVNVGRTTLYKYLKKYKIKNHGRQKYFANDNFFSKWSSEMAYCLGFISADGHVWEKRPYLSIAVSTIDRGVLEYLKDKISPTSAVRENKNHNCVQLTIKSEKIWNDLKKYNVTHEKTFNLCVNFKIPNKFFGDYLRGYFDGDGSIWVCKKFKNNIVYSGSIVSASQQFLTDIQNKLKFGRVRTTHKGKYFSLDISHKELILLKNIIYKNPTNVVMNRKYEKFLNVKINPNYNLWTIEEDNILKNNLKLMPKKLAAMLPNRTYESVKTRKNKLVKLSRNSKR